jgi:uncharacterized membrane protein YagU involved in acid resistance
MMRIARDLLVVGAAGLASTRLMSAVTTRFMQLQPQEDRRLEERVSPGIAYEVAARKTSAALGMNLTDDQAARLGMAIHYGLGIGWAPLYLVLRRGAHLHPFMAGVATGMSMNLLVDEVANTVFGFAAPPQDYPISTHLRGAVGHLTYGLALAATAEWLWSGLAAAKES